MGRKESNQTNKQNNTLTLLSGGLAEKSYRIIPDDVARTLKEGRFWSQVKKMVAWKKDFTSRGVDCSLHYILEREPEDYVVQCADGCQGVGKCGNPTLRQVKV